MSLQVEATEWLSRSMRGLAELIAGTAAFQALTGKDATNSLLDHVCWPDAGQLLAGNTLPAPCVLIAIEEGLETRAQWPHLRRGQLMVQLAVEVDETLADQRDRFTKAANQAGAVIRELLADAAANQSLSWANSVLITEPSELNDIKRFTFKRGSSAVRVRVFSFVIEWKG